MKNILLILLFSVWANSALGVEAREFSSDADAERYYELLARLRCMVCQNQSLADSNADLARDMRNVTFELMFDEKQSDDDIVKVMLDRYGEFALYRPPFNAKTVFLWVAPAIALILGLMMVARIAASSVRQSGQTDVDAKKLAAARALLSEREQQSDQRKQS